MEYLVKVIWTILDKRSLCPIPEIKAYMPKGCVTKG
jgi:hypothetical protein